MMPLQGYYVRITHQRAGEPPYWWPSKYWGNTTNGWTDERYHAHHWYPVNKKSKRLACIAIRALRALEAAEAEPGAPNFTISLMVQR